MPEESLKTQKARQKIKELLIEEGYQVTEEESFPCKNNMNEDDQILFYQADIVARKTIIVELDPMGLHGTATHRNKDHWRDKNIFREYQIPTVRLDPKNILDRNLEDTILDDIKDQLQNNPIYKIIDQKTRRKKKRYETQI